MTIRQEALRRLRLVGTVANTTVGLMRRVKTDAGWKYYPAAYAKNGRVIPKTALVDGEEVKHDTGHYELRFYRGSKLVLESLGNATPAAAEDARKKKEAQMSVVRDATAANMVVVEGPTRTTLKKTADDYIKMKQDSGLLEAAEQAILVTAEFIAVVKKAYVDEIKDTDFARFHAALRKRKLGDRTVANKHNRAASWLIFAGIDRDKIPAEPPYEKKLPTIIQREQISTLLGAADDYMTMMINIAWKCGLREQELMYLEFADINEHDRTLRVQGKPEFEFKVKDSEQRDIPIMDNLYVDLMAWKKKQPGQSLVLANEGGKPNSHLLRTLKRLARRAGLNCGRCKGCKSENQECRNYTLHHFRRTFLTTMLKKTGGDLRTVQAFAGHTDIESTARYLAPDDKHGVRQMEW